MVKIKEWTKGLMYRCLPLRTLAVWIYQCRGARPWSLGYSFYKYAFIKDTIKHNLDIFLTQPLPVHYGYGLDERVVEYPWFFSRLKNNERRILDAGSSLNHYDLLDLPLWQGRQLHITTLADEGRPAAGIKPVYVYEDLRQMSYPNVFFDAVACISTLEHVGMDNTLLYTDDLKKREHEAQAYLKVVDEMKRVLKDGGTLYLTVPYGQRRDHGWFQVFDAGMVQDVVRSFAPRAVAAEYYKYERRQWNRVEANDCAQGYYVDIHAGAHYNNDSPAASQCVVCFSLTK